MSAILSRPQCVNSPPVLTIRVGAVTQVQGQRVAIHRRPGRSVT